RAEVSIWHRPDPPASKQRTRINMAQEPEPCASPNSPSKELFPSGECLEGDVVWAKFNKKPWWPCQVIRHPVQRVHTKMKVPSPRPCRMYFLQTIGEVVDFAWIPETVVVPFENGHQFEDNLVLKRRGKQKEKDYKYKVKRINSDWESSVSKAEELFHGVKQNRPTSPNGEVLSLSPGLQSVEQLLSHDRPLSSGPVEHREHKRHHSNNPLQNGLANKRKKKRLSDIFGHIVGGSKEQTFSTGGPLKDEDSPYADLDSVPILHRPKRTELPQEREVDRGLVSQNVSAKNTSKNSKNSVDSSNSSSCLLTPQAEPTSGGLDITSTSKHLRSFPASSRLMTKALKAEGDTGLDSLMTSFTSTEVHTEHNATETTTEASTPSETAPGNSSSPETQSPVKRRARKPDKKKILNGFCKESKPHDSSIESIPDVEVKTENVSSEISFSPPLSPMEAFQNVKELKFKSIAKEEENASEESAFRPEPGYQFSTFLMLLKDMHDTRQKEGKPLSLPTSPVLIKEEPMAIPPTPAKSPREFTTQNTFTTGTKSDSDQSKSHKNNCIVQSDSGVSEDAAEKQRRKQRLPAKLKVSIPRLSSHLTNLAYGIQLAKSPSKLREETLEVKPSASEEERSKGNSHKEVTGQAKVNGSHTDLDVEVRGLRGIKSLDTRLSGNVNK
uniref:PWWP domain-containing protein n=1 Tax=Periophthalmus magnuspinnatus TaxID=409849 RepID=A0A3B4ARK0_9GOBI